MNYASGAGYCLDYYYYFYYKLIRSVRLQWAPISSVIRHYLLLFVLLFKEYLFGRFLKSHMPHKLMVYYVLFQAFKNIYCCDKLRMNLCGKCISLVCAPFIHFFSFFSVFFHWEIRPCLHLVTSEMFSIRIISGQAT